MDSYCEQLVKRTRTKKIIRVQAAVWIITLLLGAVIAFGLSYFALNTGMSVLFVLAITILGLSVYFAIKFSRALHVEFEYTFTNGSFDIDRISAKTDRVRLISADCKDIEEFGPYRESDHVGKNYAKTISAVSIHDAPGQYFAAIRQPETGKVLVIFEPDERSLEHILNFMPRKLLAEYKRNNPS